MGCRLGIVGASESPRVAASGRGGDLVGAELAVDPFGAEVPVEVDGPGPVEGCPSRCERRGDLNGQREPTGRDGGGGPVSGWGDAECDAEDEPGGRNGGGGLGAAGRDVDGDGQGEA